MNTFREFLSTIVFIAGAIFIFQMFSIGFSWPLVLGSVSCFLAAYFIWPSKKRGQRHDDNGFLDWLELLIEFPVELILWFFRIIGRLFRGDGGIDIDI